MSKIFINGFEYNTDEEVVRSHFSTVGAIKEIYFQSRGAAVIEYVKASSASRAVDELHESTMKGQSRYVAVKLDERGESDGKGKGDKGKGKGKGKGSGSGGSGRTIFISGFEYDTNDEALEWHFKKMGAIEDYHFQSKGSAVITFEKAAAAQKALAQLDGSTIHGQSRYLAIKLDDPDRSGDKGKGKGKGKGKDKGKSKGSGKYRKASGDDEDDGRSVYTSGFDFDTDDAALKEHFGGMGTIEEIYFQSKGAAVITFSEEAAATRALELANTTMKGQTRYVAVKLDTAAHRSGGSGKASGKGKWKSRE